ncbi:hypothetical protein IQ06DRAFT_348590 [Phaeosphaeriaceae sp. SRC1lsM3a]|nr:hypothetical protein IQ06DRAFT_348590 [Stagonospora sp. SRC1lsM3a]
MAHSLSPSPPITAQERSRDDPPSPPPQPPPSPAGWSRPKSLDTLTPLEI